jgi:hypothetical protein
MNKYEVVPCLQGFLAITENKWKKNAGEINTVDPFTFCPGMRVVDCFKNVVHIKRVIPPKTRIPGQVPQYCYTVKENENTYSYMEISGEVRAFILEESFERIIHEHQLIDFR